MLTRKVLEKLEKKEREIKEQEIKEKEETKADVRKLKRTLEQKERRERKNNMIIKGLEVEGDKTKGCAARINLYKLSKRLDLSVGLSFIFVRRVQK